MMKATDRTPEPDPFPVADSLGYRTIFTMAVPVGELFLRHRAWWKLALSDPESN